MRFERFYGFCKRLCIGISFLGYTSALVAQDSLKVSFGKISETDFAEPMPPYCTSANAVIIADIGKSYYEGSKMGYMQVVFKRFMRVRIMNRNGLDVGAFKLGVFLSSKAYADELDSKGVAESVSDLQGRTYNLENGKIVETLLDANSVFEEKGAGDYTVKKVAIPALKEGSIFDITYTTRSIFTHRIRNWKFKYPYPCLWSEYQARIPSSFHFRMKLQGDPNYDINTSKTIEETFRVEFGGAHGASMGEVRVSGLSSEHRWVKKNQPAIVDEPEMSTVENYTDKISFYMEYSQLTAQSERTDDYSTWEEASKTYYKFHKIGELLDGNNFWMDKTVGAIQKQARGTDEQIRNIFAYVRDHYKCTGQRGIYPTQPISETYKSFSGSIADINLLLVAMLRHAKINAYPALLSTRENGVANYDLPMMDDYNYLICVTNNGENQIVLDAGRDFNGYNRLTPECYNGGARLLCEKSPRFISLPLDSLTETRRTNVFIAQDEKGLVTCSLSTKFGFDHSYEIREELKTKAKSEYFSEVFSKSETGIEIADEALDSMENPDQPVAMRCDINLLDFNKSDLIYFNPVMIHSLNTNPFNTNLRNYPVEFQYKMDYVYILSFDIPKGFKIEELPKSTKIRLNDSQGIFDYIVQSNNDNIQMQVHLKLNRSVFNAEDYASLREFFQNVLKKESEQIVFKKVN